MRFAYLIWALVLLLGTAAIAGLDLDRASMSYFYQYCQCWNQAESGFWRFLYLYAPVPGYLLAMASLIAISWSYRSPKGLAWRKPAMMMVFCLAIGPGILVNLVFKDHWGRPRPRETQDFGGRQSFMQPWQPQANPDGKSFPCGHCSIAFYLCLPFLFLRKRSWALFFLISGLALGTLTGVARMMAGGHFLSDVLWSWGMVWFSGLLGLYLFDPLSPPKASFNPKTAKTVGWIVVVLLPLLTALVAVATPYLSSKRFSKTSQELSNTKIIVIQCFKGNFVIQKADSFQIVYQIYGFGFPGSKSGIAWKQSNDTLFATFDKTGFFTEYKNEVKLYLPGDSTRFLLRVKQGAIDLKDTLTNLIVQPYTL
jgi:membrane-associated PAP2 superfamily phosphatase